MYTLIIAKSTHTHTLILPHNSRVQTHLSYPLSTHTHALILPLIRAYARAYPTPNHRIRTLSSYPKIHAYAHTHPIPIPAHTHTLIIAKSTHTHTLILPQIHVYKHTNPTPIFPHTHTLIQPPYPCICTHSSHPKHCHHMKYYYHISSPKETRSRH